MVIVAGRFLIPCGFVLFPIPGQWRCVSSYKLDFTFFYKNIQWIDHLPSALTQKPTTYFLQHDRVKE